MSSNVAGIPSAGVGSLSTLLKRLEAATSRLEDMALAHVPGAGPGAAALANGVSFPAIGGATPRLGHTAATAEATAPSVKGWDEIVQAALDAYLSQSRDIGGLVADQAQQVQQAFTAQKSFVQMASASKKVSSSDPQFGTLLGPTQTALMAVVDVKEKNRASKQISHLSTVSEGIPALGWVTLDSKPGPYIGEMKDSAQFYANRVVKDHKDTDPKQAEWARSFLALLDALKKYVMQYHTTSLTWNPKGTDAVKYSHSSASVPPPPAAPSHNSTPQPPAAGDMGSIFAALNQGEGVTKGLKKVDASDMTHKNPELRAGGVVAPSPSGSPNIGRPAKPPKPQSFTKKPAKTELEGNKWLIENHENNQSITVENTELNQIVNVFNVKSSVIQIKGKVNAISLVNCTKTSVLLDSLVSSLSISSSQSFTVQILGRVPTILIDGTDGGQVYLSKASLDVEIITAKSSAINVSLPVGDSEEGIFEEKPVPEQLKTLVRNGKLETTVLEHSG